MNFWDVSYVHAHMQMEVFNGLTPLLFPHSLIFLPISPP